MAFEHQNRIPTRPDGEGFEPSPTALPPSRRRSVIWFTGLSGAGKSTLAEALARELCREGYQTFIVDGDAMRRTVNSDLGFSKLDRTENVRRIAELAGLLARSGIMVLVTCISPTREDRENARRISNASGTPFWEVFADAPLSVCMERDPKGLYAEASKGNIRNFVGIDLPYEAPLQPEVHIETSRFGVSACIEQIANVLRQPATDTRPHRWGNNSAGV